MIFEEIEMKGAYLIRPEKFEDDRGFFARMWCRREFYSNGLNTNFVQANLAFSRHKGTLRGMHYQINPFAEAKLIRCVRGAIYDVMIDLRGDSPTFKRWYGRELTQENYEMLFIPEGFAHGYMTLTDDAEVFYPTTQFYLPEHEQGVLWNDPAFGIKWPEINPITISEKDKSWPNFL